MLSQRSAYFFLFSLSPLLSCCSSLKLAPRTAALTASSAVSAFAPIITNFGSLPGCDLLCQGCVQTAYETCSSGCDASSCWTDTPQEYSSCVCDWFGNACLALYATNPNSFSAFGAWVNSMCPNTLNDQTWFKGSLWGPESTQMPDCAKDCSSFQALADYQGGYDECTYSAGTLDGDTMSSYTEWYTSDGAWQPAVLTTFVALDNHLADCDCYFLSTCSSYCTSTLDSSLFSLWHTSVCGSFTMPFWFHPSPMPASIINSVVSLDPAWKSFTPTKTRAIPTDAAGFFSALAPAVPPCVDSAPSLCPTLYAAVIECWSSAASSECFCSNITQSTCTQICNGGEEPETYIQWVTSACNQSSNNETETLPPQSTSWPDETYFRTLAQEHLLPWNWTIRYDSNEDHRPPGSRTPKTCPSTFSKLGSFALINLLVLTCTVVFFRRTVIYKLTRRKCGRPGSPMWLFTGILSAGLLVASNYTNAVVVRSTPGYSSVPVAQLMLLWCSRPRISWVAVLLIWVQKEQSMYFALGASALVSEAILQTLTAVYLGQCVHFASSNGYYALHTPVLDVPGGSNALMMYIGALIWAISVGAAILQIILSFLGVGRILTELGKKTAAIPRDATQNIKVAFHRRLMIKFSRSLPNALTFFKVHVLGVARRQQIAHSAVAPGNIAVTTAAHNRTVLGISGAQFALQRMTWENELHDMGLSITSMTRMQKVVGFMILPFLGQWLFWAGLVRLYGDRYCPPQIGYLTLIWSIFATSGIFTSSAL